MALTGKKKFSNKHKYLHFTILCKKVSNYHNTFGGFAWNEQRGSFSWDVTRPETGEQTFQRNCPHCGAELAIGVESSGIISSQTKRSRKVGKALLILSVAFAIALIGSFFFNEDIRLLGIIISGIALFSSLSFAGAMFVSPPGFAAKGELKPFGHDPAGSCSGHYIQTLESEA